VALQENAPQWPPPQYAPRPPLRLEEHQRDAGNADPFAQAGCLRCAAGVFMPQHAFCRSFSCMALNAVLEGSQTKRVLGFWWLSAA